MTELKRIFTVDGRAFFPLGGQARNSSGYNDLESDTAFRAVVLLHGNTLEIPVYWGQVEPEEGRFDFASVDALLAQARKYGLRLVLLWFGSWKNGDMDYTPDWVKTNPQRFRRVISPTGKELWDLSMSYPANLEADARAFSALCWHLLEKDKAERTVIAIQVENEPGILGSDRDYAPEAQKVFASPVPAELVAKMKASGGGKVYDLWQQAGAKSFGFWAELFGSSGGEMMSAWSIATYIDGVAQAGKAVYDLPMYINVWLGEFGWMIPGETYPSGGAVARTLDIYKWFTPHIDLIAPDIYLADSKGYEATCACYSRADNPLFIPESAPGSSNPWLMFRSIADYNAIGYAFFAVEHLLAADGSLRPEYQVLADSFRSTAAALPLLLKYQGTDKIHSVAQDENVGAQRIALKGWLGMVEFGDGGASFSFKDWRHLPKVSGSVSYNENRGRGLIFQVSRNEFYLVGANYRLLLRPSLSPQQALDVSVAGGFMLTRQAHVVSADEGHFDDRGAYVVDRRRNGDEIDSGIWVEADCGVVRLVMCE